MNGAAQELSCIHRSCYRLVLNLGDGGICQIWQVEERGQCAGFAAVPDGSEQVFLQNGLVGEEKQPVAALQLGTGCKE